jgi:hypothetical protein
VSFIQKWRVGRLKTGPGWGLGQVGGGGYKERVEEGEYGGNIVYSGMKMEK